jgi:serine/threonine protein phosphatase PrpC
VGSDDASVVDASAATDAGLPLCLGSEPYLTPTPEPLPPPQPPVAHTNVPPIPGTFLLALGVLAAALTLALLLFRARRAPPIVPAPPEVARGEIGEAASANAAAEPIATSQPRHLAIESRKGPVRARCEDRSAVFEVGDIVGIVTADGMGGHPDGEAAAEIAVDSARRALVREFVRADRVLSLPVLARAAIGAAAGALRRVAPAFGYRPDDAALSTTLLVLLADREHYVAAYLGDGGIVVARADGSVDVLMEPQNGDAPNIVEGCVGPSGIEGRPEVRTAPRRPGDVALVGTDGVFARVPAEFPGRMRELVVRRADAALAIHEALDALEAVRDEHGPVADDNLSLGALWTEG